MTGNVDGWFDAWWTGERPEMWMVGLMRGGLESDWKCGWLVSCVVDWRVTGNADGWIEVQG